jgi:hypothetical protein
VVLDQPRAGAPQITPADESGELESRAGGVHART